MFVDKNTVGCIYTLSSAFNSQPDLLHAAHIGSIGENGFLLSWFKMQVGLRSTT